MGASVTVRMYNQEDLGDCFLLKFSDKGEDSFLLIDFGSYEGGNEVRERLIANSIKDTVKDSPLRIVLTHQHKDHLTGFITAAEVLKTLTVPEVWFSYLDDPKSKEGKQMRKATENLWNKDNKTKELAKLKFKNDKRVMDMLEAKDNLNLFAEVQTGGDAVSNLIDWCGGQCKFLLPGQHFLMPGLSSESVKVYVLGPPTDLTLFKKMNPTKAEAVHSLDVLHTLNNLDTASDLMADAINSFDNPDAGAAGHFPFHNKYCIPESSAILAKGRIDYEKSDNQWRRIDQDWLSELGRVSLHMANYTNNSSLVLAFELVESNKVLLFAADAQIGNWQSWFDVSFKDSDTTVRDLLSKTVLYKAGHHSSHNSTLLEGLDLMDEKELVIMIPVNEKVSKKRKFSMLKPGMLKGYNRKAQGRVLRSDTIYHKPGRVKSRFKFASNESDFVPRLKVHKDDQTHLYVEYVVK